WTLALVRDDSEDSSEPRVTEADLAASMVPPGFRLRLHAAHPLLRNPVAMCFDGRVRILVVETSCPITWTPAYSDEQLACRTWEEAESLRRRDESSPRRKSERLIRLEDRSGAGDANHRQVLYEGFSASDGIAAGVLEHEGRVWLANCPKLWLLTPSEKALAAPPRPLLHGFGCRRVNLGHDLHGLILGPDGKLYFSIGDRGLHVETLEGKIIDLPDTGAVLRCE